MRTTKNNIHIQQLVTSSVNVAHADVLKLRQLHRLISLVKLLDVNQPQLAASHTADVSHQSLCNSLYVPTISCNTITNRWSKEGGVHRSGTMPPLFSTV